MSPHSSQQDGSRTVGALLATVLLIATIFGGWNFALSKSNGGLEAEVEQLEQARVRAIAERQKTQDQQEKSQRVLSAIEKIKDEQSQNSFATVLRSISVALAPDIGIKALRTSRAAESPSKQLFRIEGGATGVLPRKIADQFLQRLEQELNRHVRIEERFNFERLDDEPSSAVANPREHQAAFTISGIVGITLSQAAAFAPK